MPPKVSICIACHNQAHFLPDLLNSCVIQDYPNKEIILLDDCSSDNTPAFKDKPDIFYFRSDEPSGSGGAFNKAISHATGDIIILMCSDDIFTNNLVISDIINCFNQYPDVVHVSRYYYQFMDGDQHPVRAWRCNDIIELANNPSGLAFRKESIGECQLTNKMFVEAPTFVNCVLQKGKFAILQYDTVAVRIHASTARSKDYYRKRWTSSPVEEWSKVGGKSIQKDYTSFIQIKNYFTTSAVLKECGNFICLRPLNLLTPAFWFFALIAIFTPRFILLKIPDLYRRTWGRWTTAEVKRPV